MYPQPVVDHGHRVGAHLAGTDRVIGCLSIVPDPIEQFVIALNINAGSDLVVCDVAHRRRRHDATGDAHRFERHLAVEMGGEEIETDRRRGMRRARCHMDTAVLSERRMFMIAVTPESFASWKLSPTRNGIREIAASGASSPG